MELLQHLTEVALKNKDDLHTTHQSNLVSYLFVKGDEVRFADNLACYYQVEHGVPWKKGITGIISSCKRYRQLNEDKLRTWLEFHVNDPIFGQAILSKDVSWMMEHRLIISDTSAPGNLMQGVLVSIRQAWEYDQIVNSYYELIKADINPCLAYNLAHFLYVSDSNNYKLQTYGPGHNLFYGSRITKRHLANWFKGELDKPLKPYIENSAYSGTERMFDRSYNYKDDCVVSSWFQDWVKKVMIVTKSDKSNSPFGKALVSAGASYSIEKLNAAIKEHEEYIIKELTNV